MPIPAGRQHPGHEPMYSGNVYNGYGGGPVLEGPPQGMHYGGPQMNGHGPRHIHNGYGDGPPGSAGPPPRRNREGSENGYSSGENMQRTSSDPAMRRESPEPRNRFHVEHLCQFTLDRKEGLTTVEDALRKLKLMDARGKIWSQEVVLLATERDIILLDEMSEDLLEKFSLSDISMISAEMNQMTYNSILVLRFQFSNKKPPELYLFQCDKQPAIQVAAQLRRHVDYMLGRTPRRQSRNQPQNVRRQMSDTGMYVPPPPNEPAPIPPEANVRNKVAAYAAAAAAQAGGQLYSPRPSLTTAKPLEQEESLEQLAMRTQRDVEILNRCFDEVEYFVQRLQKAAEAYQELVVRRKHRRSKQREHGDGLLLARSRPPPDSAYFEIYQIIKYCLNLLSKLKNHIHDPNAPELVHFLFVPLQLIIDSNQGPETARRVEAPLLSPQTVELLKNCLTSRESQVWMSLGPAWNTSTAEWPRDNPVPPYQLKFRDGWVPPHEPEFQGPVMTPPADINTQLAVTAGVAAEAAATAARHENRRSVNMERTYDPIMSHPDYNSDNQRGAPPLPSPRKLEPPPAVRPKPPPAPASPVQSYSANRVKASFDFVARNPKELTIMAGETLDVLDNSRKWWEVRNSSGQSGFVPSTILESFAGYSSGSNHNQNHSNSSGSGNAPDSPYAGRREPAQAVRKESSQAAAVPPPPPPPPPPPVAPVPPPAPLVIKGLSKGPPKPNSLQAHQLSSNDFQMELSNTIRRKQQLRQKGSMGDMFANNNTKKDNRTSDALQDELMRRVSEGAPKRNYKVVKNSGPQVFIDYASTPAEVTAWLRSKNFTALTVTSLGVLSGAQLFSLTRDELMQVCHDEGSRVYSQLMVQKSNLTAGRHSTSSELRAIMERRKIRSITEDELPPDFDPALPNGSY